jgi:hypothetical protein
MGKGDHVPEAAECGAGDHAVLVGDPDGGDRQVLEEVVELRFVVVAAASALAPTEEAEESSGALQDRVGLIDNKHVRGGGE